MMNRRKAREYAFILLFEYRFQPDAIGELLNRFCEEREPGNQEAYIRSSVCGAVEHIREIDDIIEAYAKDWSADRISNVCMAAMRLAICEMKYQAGIPAAVAVNEAITLVKKYDGEESVGFVNGVLGNFKKDSENSK